MKNYAKILLAPLIAVAFAAAIRNAVYADASDITASEASKIVNEQLSDATNITIKSYIGRISGDSYISTNAANKKTGVVYYDLASIRYPEMYTKGKRVYWHSQNGKWYYYNKSVSNSVKYYNMSISDGSKCSISGYSKFNGKKCIALKVTVDKRITKYYIGTNDMKLKGMESGSGNTKIQMTIDFNKKVSIPASAKKASKKLYTYSEKLENGMNDTICVGVSDASKLTDAKITSVKQLKSYADEIAAGESELKAALEKYDAKYFKSNVLYVKKSEKFHQNDAFAFKRIAGKSGSANTITINITEYNAGVDSTTSYEDAVLVEVSKKQAKNLKSSNIKIKYTDSTGVLPVIK